MKRYFSVSLIFLALFAAGCAHLGMGSRTDQQIASDVQNKINADTNFPDKQLNVSAANGVVTLSGNVSSDAARSAAANDAAQVEGVRTVVNNLRVAAPVTAASSEPPSSPQKQTSYNPPAAYSSPAKASRPSPRTSAPRASNTSAKAADPQNNNSSDSDARTTAPYTGTVNSASGSDNTATASPANSDPVTPAAPPAPRMITVPAGTQLSIRINEELSSEKAQVGDVFHGSISTPVMVDETMVIPTSADVEGRVVDVKPATRFAGKSDLVIELTRLLMNGKSYSLATDRWSKAGSSRGKATAAKVGGGAALGAIIGGIVGGGKGAAIGAAAGAGAGTGVSAATKGQQVVLKPETVLNFQLENSIVVVPGVSRQPMVDDRVRQ